MHLQARTLYEVDPLGRLWRVPDLTTPESQWEPAPRFFMGRTALGNVWRFRYDLPAELKERLAMLCRTEPAWQIGTGPCMAAEIHEFLCGGEEWRGPFTAVIENGQAVAVCSSVRQSEKASEAGVFTLESSRGNGHAAQVTALWANLVRQQGRLPLYSTSWENTASQAVARKLNGQLYGEDWLMT